MKDSELRELILSSPAEGHRALYDTYVNYVYAIIFRILRDCGTKEDIEDCLVETFTGIIRHMEHIRSEQLKAYIGQTARNRALNYAAALQRERQNTVPLENTPEPAAEDLQLVMEQRQLRSVLLNEIAALGEPDATILIQKYYYGRKMSEIGKMTGLTANAAQVRCSRALKRLRDQFKDWRE